MKVLLISVKHWLKCWVLEYLTHLIFKLVWPHPCQAYLEAEFVLFARNKALLFKCVCPHFLKLFILCPCLLCWNFDYAACSYWWSYGRASWAKRSGLKSNFCKPTSFTGEEELTPNGYWFYISFYFSMKIIDESKTTNPDIPLFVDDEN